MSRWLKPRSMDHHEFSLSVVPLIALSYGLICHLLLPGHLPHDKLINSTLQHTTLKSLGTGVAQGRGGCWGNVEAWNWSTYKLQGSVVSYWLKVELLSRSFTIKNVMFNGKWMLFYGVRVNTWPNNLKMKQINSGYHSTFIFVHMYSRLRNLLHFLSSSFNL